MTGFWLVVVNVKNQPDFPRFIFGGKAAKSSFFKKPLLWEF